MHIMCTDMYTMCIMSGTVFVGMYGCRDIFVRLRCEILVKVVEVSLLGLRQHGERIPAQSKVIED